MPDLTLEIPGVTQTCYICTQALHWKTKEGLVRGCACRGTSGFAHVSCLAEQAKILVAEAVENNLGAKAFDERWARWYECSLCEQRYHSVVSCALGWACWQGSKRAQRARARVFKFSSPFTRTRLLPPDTLHLPAPLPAPLSSPKTRELGNFGPNFHYAQALFLNDRASRDDVVESIAIHEELAATARRVLGPAYPLTTSIQDTFAQARERLASFDK